MVFMNFNPSDKRFALKRPKTITERLQEAIQQNQRPEYQLPVFPSMISTNSPYNIGSFSPTPIGSISPIEENQSTPIPREEIPPSMGNHVSVPTAPVTSQEQLPEPEPSFWDKLSRFSQSDVSKNIDDFLLGAMTASPDSSGWQLFAKGLKNLHEGDKQRGQINQTVEYLKSKGYSEEEAAVMARNPQMLSALLTGGDKPKLSADYQLITNPETGEYEAKIIKGSKTYEEAERAKKLHEKNIVRDTVLFNDIGYLDEYMKKHGTYSTGLIAWLKSWMPGTEARGADRVVQALRSHIASNRIDELKSLSRTGGLGLGNVSDKDLDMLKDSLGALSIDMNVELFARSLSQIKDVLEKLSPEAKTFLLGKNNEVQTISQGGSANIPKMSMQEGINRDDITVFIDVATGKRIEKEEY
ncbi:hypothetical protein [Bartonella florencae]|uniref:hypothetical protein n=1 Tax=Bartonella florencae TaxID=928210 RepID=UPI0002F4A904|nr:hypothetical protein [Bartonella florencae]